MMNLHAEQLGAGAELVLVHGWGLHGGVWKDLAARLAPRWRVTIPDLPGHGRSPMPDHGFTLADVAHGLLAACPPQAVWIGWSLGGLAALAAARQRPEAIAGLVLVSCTPRFASSPDWPHGLSPEVLAEFARDLETDYETTLIRFLSLQFGNGQAERTSLRQLRADMFSRGRPAVAALAAGLSILLSSDLRDVLPEITARTLVVHGDRDRLAKPTAAEYLARTLPNARLHRMAGAGHAPFVSHADAFAEVVEGFLHG